MGGPGTIRAALGAASLFVMLWAGLWLTSLPPCDFEDSPNCYWDADTMGNGSGLSFVSIDGPGFALLIRH